MTDKVTTTQTTRAYYQDARKPDTEKMKGDAAVGGGNGKISPYHPSGEGDKLGVTTEYSNGNKVTIWECEDANGNVTTATSIKIGNKTYYDWDSDGKIDCVDTEKTVTKKKEEVEQSLKGLGINTSQMPQMGI